MSQPKSTPTPVLSSFLGYYLPNLGVWCSGAFLSAVGGRAFLKAIAKEMTLSESINGKKPLRCKLRGCDGV